MRILITGASSFVGAHLALAGARRHEVIGLHHATPLDLPGVRSVRLDLASPQAARELASLRPEAVIHAAFKVKRPGRGPHPWPDETSRLNAAMLSAVSSLGLPLLYASSTVVHWTRLSAYARDRVREEAQVSSLLQPWAILRPCAPYGPRLAGHTPTHKESFHLLAELVHHLPVVPVVGDGRYLRQPIHVGDFAQAAWALVEGGLPRRAFDAGGPEVLSFNEVINTLARAARRRPPMKLHVPARVFTTIAPFTRDFDPELLALLATNDVADPADLTHATGVSPRPLILGAHDLFRAPGPPSLRRRLTSRVSVLTWMVTCCQRCP